MIKTSITYLISFKALVNQWCVALLLVGFIGLNNPDVQAHSQEDIISELVINSASTTKTWKTYNFAFDSSSIFLKEARLQLNKLLFQKALYTSLEVFNRAFQVNRLKVFTYDDQQLVIIHTLQKASKDFPSISS